ncbi:hypothetical protein J1614_008239 [Plenodomus biglobosus]|nr:hypothetical protein J1614_008239 [Plenodomus biglobosus]
MSSNESPPLSTTSSRQPNRQKKRSISMKAECGCSATANNRHPIDHEKQISPTIAPADLASRELQFKHLGSQFYGNDGGRF